VDLAGLDDRERERLPVLVEQLPRDRHPVAVYLASEYKGYNGSPPSRSALLMAPIKPIPPLSKA